MLVSVSGPSGMVRRMKRCIGLCLKRGVEGGGGEDIGGVGGIPGGEKGVEGGGA